MSWGWKITLLYAGFVVLIATMVGLTMRENVDLVSKDYYEQELKYQDRIDQMDNARQLDEPLDWETGDGVLSFHFPEEFKGKVKSGKIFFFRPSDAKLDKQVKLAPDTLQARTVPTEMLVHGAYKMQVTWESGGKQYYNEGIIQIN